MIIQILLLWLLLPAPSVVIETVTKDFNQAASLTSAVDGSVFVIDHQLNALIEYDGNGKKVKQLGGKGWGDYEFDTPTDVWSSFLLEVYVTDQNNHRIQKYDKDLNFVQTYDEQSINKLEGRFYPLACATSSRGDLFVIETDGVRILKINKRNQVESEFGTYRDGAGKLTQPKDIAISDSDEIFVLDQSDIKVFDVYGNYIRTIPLFGKEQWKNIHLSGRVLIATSSQNIKFIQMDSSSESEIEKSSIAGFDRKEDFQDAAVIHDHLFILTSTTLYRCSLH